MAVAMLTDKALRRSVGLVLIAASSGLACRSILTMNEWESMGGPMALSYDKPLSLFTYVAAMMVAALAFRFAPAASKVSVSVLGLVLIVIALCNLVDSPPFSGAFFMQRDNAELWYDRLLPSLTQHSVAVALAGLTVYAGLYLLLVHRARMRNTHGTQGLLLIGLCGIAIYAASWVLVSRCLFNVLGVIEMGGSSGFADVAGPAPFVILILAVAALLLLRRWPFLIAGAAIPCVLGLMMAACLAIAYELG